MENEVLTEVIKSLEEMAQEYQSHTPVIPWGELRNRLIANSEKLKMLRRNLESQADLVQLREIEDDENLELRSQFE